MNSRTEASQRFLNAAGWGDAQRNFLAGDASDRSYDRLTKGDATAVLMDSPPGKGDDPADFVAIAAHLQRIGLSSPKCLAQDFDNGFLLLEDLGDDLFAKIVANSPTSEIPLYTAASDVLLHMQGQKAPQGLPNLTSEDWATAACFVLDWYRFAVTGERISTKDFHSALSKTLHRYADGPRVLILRDFHAENLIWLPHRVGVARVGLLDFQLAQMGQPSYDLVSLLQDARRDVAPETEHLVRRGFQESLGQSDKVFLPSYAALGAQRALRILGIFARLCLNGGKPGYLKLIPRVWAQLQRNLAVPELAELSLCCSRLLPEPTPEILLKIGAQCGHFR